MSFDLFVICPAFDRAAAEGFNRLVRPGLPEGLSMDLEQFSDDDSVWIVEQDGEEWAELQVDCVASCGQSQRPTEIAAGWTEIHVASRGEPMDFQLVAALAEVSRGWVFDPQRAAKEVSLPVPAEQASHVEHGYYTPAITRQLADLLATGYRWD